ncbi:hypothetical protein CEUSTIGMA_g8189.t1 [Chlamydomonas eustigma]|uniref:Auxin efflux carrier family protein n=1 Tax=Chlamydomonas eustigma TaxID=1157962 RepID=A0A250XCF3_9CHLO|nr:hypothetical protein CEUSTIGMA_g8189.t1 [Chlamydomonas eustigma]|eukprot:GAX80754.1 hypothetical protein CEUSTIGMA_g8189.t1 [Chlamydomonas eustigma]
MHAFRRISTFNHNRTRYSAISLDKCLHLETKESLKARGTTLVFALPGFFPQPPDAIIFSASAQPVIKIGMLCAVGSWCANKGILTEDGRRVLSGITYHVFGPCLFLTKLSDFPLSEILRLWPLNANMVLTHLLGACIGLLVVRLASSPPSLHKHLVLSSSVGNVANLPLVVMDSLGRDPNVIAVLGPSASNGVLYLMLASVAATFIQWPLLSHFMRPVKIGEEVVSNLMMQGPALPLMQMLMSVLKGSGVPMMQKLITVLKSPDSWPMAQKVMSVLKDPGWPLLQKMMSVLNGPGWPFLQKTMSVLKATRDAFLTPPILSSVAALVVGQIPALKAALFSPSGQLHLIGEVANVFGECLIPSVMLMLGANLSKGPGAGEVPALSLICTVIARLVVLPTVGTACILGAHSLGLLKQCDPTVLVVMLLTHAVPTALMLHGMATMYSDKEDEVANILFWQYLACVITLPICMSVFLSIAPQLAAKG